MLRKDVRRVRSLGETDLNPVSAIGKISQLLFALIQPGNVVANLLAGGPSSSLSLLLYPSHLPFLAQASAKPGRNKPATSCKTSKRVTYTALVRRCSLSDR